ncbi:MAG: hypothetical protein ABSC15_20760 [Terriglobales bacterium]|jgi:hypothetical protein
MKCPCMFKIIAALASVALSLLTTPAMTAQTVISNEALVSTTFVVNKQSATAKCGTVGCSARASWFGPISITCPAPTGQTCTFHISLDAKTTIVLGGHGGGSGSIGSYQFLVDGAAPTIGPTDKNGDYLFERDVYTVSTPTDASRQSYPASVLATVTNSNSNGHAIALGLGCKDIGNEGGCQTTAHWTTMRVDVFEP